MGKLLAQTTDSDLGSLRYQNFSTSREPTSGGGGYIPPQISPNTKPLQNSPATKPPASKPVTYTDADLRRLTQDILRQVNNNPGQQFNGQKINGTIAWELNNKPGSAYSSYFTAMGNSGYAVAADLKARFPDLFVQPESSSGSANDTGTQTSTNNDNSSSSSTNSGKNTDAKQSGGGDSGKGIIETLFPDNTSGNSTDTNTNSSSGSSVVTAEGQNLINKTVNKLKTVDNSVWYAAGGTVATLIVLKALLK